MISNQSIPCVLPPVGLRLLLTCTLFVTATSLAEAQSGFGRPNDRPTFSPYLNLFRNQNRGSSGANTLFNYYGLVRPQNRAFEQNQQITQGLQDLRRNSRAPQASRSRGIPRYSQMGITGHPTAFMTIRPGANGGDSGGFGGGIGGGIGGGGFGGDIGGGALGGSFGAGSLGGANIGGNFGGVGGVGGFGLGSVTGHPAAFSTGVRRGGGTGFGNN